MEPSHAAADLARQRGVDVMADTLQTLKGAVEPFDAILAIDVVEHLVDPGEIAADDVHTPGVFVQRVVALTEEQVAAKQIEKRTTRPRPTVEGASS